MSPEQTELFKELDNLDTISVGVFYYPQNGLSTPNEHVEHLTKTLRIINHIDMIIRFSEVNNASPTFNAEILNWLLKVKRLVWFEREAIERNIQKASDALRASAQITDAISESGDV